MMTNPLTKYYRVPKLYVPLPSRGLFYPENSMDTSVNNELAVYALSAVDQILLKTPDAMLNGETLTQIVKNCVPGIKHVNLLVEPDINTLLLAIRIATTGAAMEHECECPSCKKTQKVEINLPQFIESQSFLDNHPTITINDELVVAIRPFNFEQRNISLLNEVAESQAINLLQQDTDIDTEHQAQKVAAIVAQMTDRLFELIAKSVISVTIVSENKIVTDPAHILEFIKGINKSQADVIGAKIKELNKVGIDTTSNFICDSCSHTWSHQLDFDPLSFFD